jgi:hypothetical protein
LPVAAIAAAITLILACSCKRADRGSSAPRPSMDAARVSSPRDEALRATLIKMAKEDQAEVARAMRAPLGPQEQGAPQRTALLKQIVAAYGWPGISLVGDDGAAAAWIIAQHSDFDPAFQRQCLALMERAYEAREVAGAHLAYLTDRVLTAQNRPQRYGTQGAPRFSAEEKAQVEARRRSVGLPSMEETARSRGEMYRKLMTSPVDGSPAAP